MSEERLNVCDGCKPKRTILEKISERYRLKLETGSFWDGVESGTALKNLEFCERCASDIKAALLRIAERLSKS